MTIFLASNFRLLLAVVPAQVISIVTSSMTLHDTTELKNPSRAIICKKELAMLLPVWTGMCITNSIIKKI